MRGTSHLPLIRAARRLSPAVAVAIAALVLIPTPALSARRPALRVGDARVAESAAKMVFTVKLRGKPRRPVTVRYATVDRTATAGSDYVAVSGKLRFTASKRMRRVAVEVLDDAEEEPRETFLLRLGAAKRAALADRVGVGTILDDDSDTELPPGALVLNEIDYDQVGADDAEYVEILNPSEGPFELDGVELHLVNGSTLASYAAIDLSSAASLDAGGYLVVAMPGVDVPPGTPTIELPVAIQNGPDGIALVARGETSCSVIDALSYEGEIDGVTLEACEGLHGLVEGMATEAADSNTDHGALARLPNGSDTDDAATDWSFTPMPTPGEANVAG